MHGSRIGGFLVVAAAAAASAFTASAQSDCDVGALTSPPGALALVPPAFSADGSVIAFVSNHDLAGGANADGSFEAFLHDVATGEFFQLTDSADAAFSGLSMNADGTKIAFASDLDLDGGNFDRNSEIWLFDRGAAAITQVTATFGSGLGNVSPSLDATGMTIVFVSDESLVDGANADGNAEVIAFDVDSSAFSLVTDSASGQVRAAVLAADGSSVFFLSNGDLVLENADGGDELFVLDRATGVVRQLTHDTAPGGLSRPSPSADGSLVAFSSDRDPTGDNNDLNSEAFVVDVATGEVRQATKATGGAGSFDAALSSDGARLALASDGNLSGRNADGNVEVFRLDLADGRIAQVTDAAGRTSRMPSTFGGGDSVGFVSTASSDGSFQLFLADGCAVPPLERAVPIDIMPRSRQNRIDLSSRGRVRVAILTTRVADGDAADFDAATVAPRSVRFGPAGARETKTRIRMRDVDDDGDLDQVMHFKISETGIELGDREACLEGVTGDGAPFRGCDMVNPFRKRR